MKSKMKGQTVESLLSTLFRPTNVTICRECMDYQEIKIQDSTEKLSLGSVPRSIVVILETDLVDRFNPGDDVVVVGTMLRQWRPLCKGARCEVDIVILANSVKSLNANATKAQSKESLDEFVQYWKTHREQGRELVGRDGIIRAVCPQLYGLYGIKLAVVLTLIGGSDPNKKRRITDITKIDQDDVEEEEEEAANGDSEYRNFSNGAGIGFDDDYDDDDDDDDANVVADDKIFAATSRKKRRLGSRKVMRTRSQSHLLLVGDPGTGKSQILRFAASVIPRSVITTGIGTTGSGLTCTAVKDGSDWCIEAGALVLANGGVCCIDEFSSIKEQDRATIHEAMEQQTLSVAKAGLVVKLNTKTTVVAACNPKGTYDLSADITTNTAIASPLLSRFDLIILLLDQPDKEYDKRISTFLLRQATCQVSKGDRGSAQNELSAVDVSNPTTESTSFVWDADRLRQYILFVRDRIQPILSQEAAAILQRYYQLQRQSDDRSSSRTTVRLLESLMRLASAHAKLMFRTTAILQDAVVAIACLASSQSQMQSHSSLSSTPGAWGSLGLGANHANCTQTFLHYDFSEQPDADYIHLEAQVLAALHCNRDSLDITKGVDSANNVHKGNISGDRNSCVPSENPPKKLPTLLKPVVDFSPQFVTRKDLVDTADTNVYNSVTSNLRRADSEGHEIRTHPHVTSISQTANMYISSSERSEEEKASFRAYFAESSRHVSMTDTRITDCAPSMAVSPECSSTTFEITGTLMAENSISSFVVVDDW